MAEKELQEPLGDDIQAEIEQNATEDVDIDLGQLLDQVKLAVDERDEMRGQLLRTMADFQNYKRRVSDEKKQIEARANEKFIADLLPVLDNFERAIVTSNKGGKVESIIEGIRAIERQLRSVLEGQKVERIVSIGQTFDPDLHDALGTVDSMEHEEGTIVEEIESGYKFGDRVIRPARVRVSKKP